MPTIKGINTLADLKKFLGTRRVSMRAVTQHEPKQRKRKPAEFVAASIVGPTPGYTWQRLTIMVPVETASEINGRNWRAFHRRTGKAWTAVRNAIGSRLDFLAPYAHHYAKGGGLKVRFTRLGGRAIDNANLGTTLKGCEDALAYMLGANDGDQRWKSSYEKEPGGLVGVRIELETL